MKWDLDERADNVRTVTELKYEREIAELNATIARLNKALNVEVWDHKKAKFIPFKETPEVAKVLNDDS